MSSDKDYKASEKRLEKIRAKYDDVVIDYTIDFGMVDVSIKNNSPWAPTQSNRRRFDALSTKGFSQAESFKDRKQLNIVTRHKQIEKLEAEMYTEIEKAVSSGKSSAAIKAIQLKYKERYTKILIAANEKEIQLYEKQINNILEARTAIKKMQR